MGAKELERTYSDAEVDEILKAALRQQDGIAHDDLVAAAEEIGIPREAVERAADKLESAEETAEIAAYQRQRKQRFISHFSTYAIVSVFLLLLNLMTSDVMWAKFPILAWGLFVALHGARLFQPSESPGQRQRRRQASRAKRKQQAKIRKREQKQAARRRKARAKARMEAAVEDGVASLLEAVARQIDRKVGSIEGRVADGPRSRAEGEFARYVRSKRPGSKRKSKDRDERRTEEKGSKGTKAKKRKARPVRAPEPSVGDPYTEEELAEAEAELEQYL